jgi:hypothetical protein
MLTVACSRCRHLIHLGHHVPGQPVCCPACHAQFVPADAPAVRRPSWPLVATALLPLGIPLVNFGAGWAALAVALAAVCLVLSVCRRPALVLRLGLALALGGLGYAPALTARLAGAGENTPPSGGPSELGPPVATVRTGDRLDMLPPPNIARGGGRGRGLAPPVALPPAVELVAPPAAPSAGPRLAARVAEALAAAIDPKTGAALLLTRHGGLRHYSYPDFRLRGSYRLDRPAYRAALDGRRGLLFVASCPARLLAQSVGTTGDREGAPGDLRVYDVGALLRGAEPPGAELAPLATIPDIGYVTSLVLAPDRRSLFLLGVGRQLVTLFRVNTTSRAIAAEQSMRGGAGALALSPDGRRLYATSVSGVLVIDPHSLEITRRALLPFVPFDLAADDGGRVFVSSSGERPVVVVLDMNRDEPVVGHWAAPFPGRLYLRLTPDGRHLYLGTSSVSADRLHALRVDGARASRPLLEGTVSTDDDGLVRGEFQITPDGRFLLNRWGKVYRLPAGT